MNINKLIQSAFGKKSPAKGRSIEISLNCKDGLYAVFINHKVIEESVSRDINVANQVYKKACEDPILYLGTELVTIKQTRLCV